MAILPFSPPNEENGRIFNNADSFAMAFDSAWKKINSESEDNATTTEKKIKTVIERIKDHPFLIEYPEEAKEVAKFRVRLLKLK